MTLRHLLLTTPVLNLPALSLRMYQDPALLEQKLSGLLPFTRADEVLALAALKQVGAELAQLVTD